MKKSVENRVRNLEKQILPKPAAEKFELFPEGFWDALTEPERERIRDAATILLRKREQGLSDDEQRQVTETEQWILVKRGEFLEQENS